MGNVRPSRRIREGKQQHNRMRLLRNNEGNKEKCFENLRTIPVILDSVVAKSAKSG